MLNHLDKILTLSRQNSAPIFVRNAKLMEEVGEFSECLMHSMGFLPHKTMSEPLEGEVADVLICLLDTYAAVRTDLTSEQIIATIAAQLEKKSLKWEKIINQPN